MMPLRVAMPNSVMKPIIDATLSTPPARNTPATPPISASGRLTMTSSASRGRPNASTSSMNRPAIDADARARAAAATRSARSRTGRRTRRDSPAGIGTDCATAARMSSTTLPRSRPATLHEITIRRCTFSRRIMFGPSSRRTSASSRIGTVAAGRRVDRQIGDALEVGAARRIELARPGRTRVPRSKIAADGRAGEARLDRLGDVVGAQAVARDRRAVRARSGRTARPSAARATGRRRPGRRSSPRARARRAGAACARSSPNTLTAMFARVPDSM